MELIRFDVRAALIYPDTFPVSARVELPPL